jgi:3-oxoacyl-(acyl-carrier-protein) synthase
MKDVSDWVITDSGVITAAGNTAAAVHQALCDARPLARVSEDENTAGLAIAPIENFQAKDHIQRRGLRDLSRTSQFACVAAAPLAKRLEGVEPIDVGVALGTGWGSLESVVAFEWETCSVSPRFLNPLLFAETVANVPGGQISIFFGWSGFSLTVSCGGASGLDAMAQGIDLLEEERAPMLVVGGADALNAPVLQVLEADGVIAPGAGSLPFARDRSGPVGGEGAALLVVESAAHAAARGAVPLAHVGAMAERLSGGAQGETSARSSDIAELIGTLLERAGLAPAEVDLIASSADGSPADAEEAVALHQLFGDGDSAPLVMAPKGILGETWGASGPVAAAVVLECFGSGRIPGRPEGFVVDPHLPPLRMPATTSEAALRHAVVLARSRGGYVSAMLLSRPDPGVS